MKGDIVMKLLASLLIPFMLFAGFLVMKNYSYLGFFAFINALIFFVIAYFLYYLRYGKIKTYKIKFFDFVLLGVVVTIITFLCYIMFKLIYTI